MIKILFVCWGNICRSPMSEFIMKDLVEKRHLSGQFLIESAAHTSEEIGNPVYPPAARELARHGIRCAGKRARRITKADYDKFNWILGMEQLNIGYMLRCFGGDPEHKVRRLLDFSDHPRDIADPWYTGEFGLTYTEIVEGCESLLSYLLRENPELYKMNEDV
ncbi:MAG: low molecular weight phosphotyrosine protein phosphatase [Lachnospiraceae bacterium]|nr:low molecular weight phosphotyrosine protein phosphatase [Lachnospiraceae bacterium]